LAAKYEVHYMDHTIGYKEERDEWSKVLKFINFLDNYGMGYAFAIDVDEEPAYKRILNHADGTDYWINYDGEEVDLEREYWSTV
jgi:hypothetical protein